MTHAIAALQTSIVAALNADAALVALIGTDAVFDLAPKGPARLLSLCVTI